jgi:hypothetical protein
MTPQQKKADELVERFRDHAHMNWDEYHGWDEKQGEENAIQCAIICVEREIEALDSVLDSRRHFRTIHENEVYDELQSVLNELKSRL